MSSRILIGTDEAGYGPNLGPLIVTATAWELPADLDPQGLWNVLKKVLTNSPARDDHRLFVADSKAVYSSGDSLEDLEVPVLAFLKMLNLSTSNIEDVGTAIGGAHFARAYAAEIWNPSPGMSLPVDSSEDHILEWQESLQRELSEQHIRLIAIRSRIMFPKEFNELTAAAGSKGAVLSAATLQLVRELSDLHANDSPVLVVCDKHGGRNRYDEIISAHFDDQLVFRVEESTQKSRYRMGKHEFLFRTKAEEVLPVALASMVSKYLREVFMDQFNNFWAAHVSDLKPTQGYPVDAKRFLAEIAEAIQSLDVPECELWRSR